MVYFASKYPLPPPVPDANIHELLFNAPTPNGEPTPDYDLHIDIVTGRKRTFYEFRELIRDGATALGAPIPQGGLGLSGQQGDIVGIYSHNCMVGCLIKPSRSQRVLTYTGPIGLHRTCALVVDHHNTDSLVLCVWNCL